MPKQVRVVIFKPNEEGFVDWLNSDNNNDSFNSSLRSICGEEISFHSMGLPRPFSLVCHDHGYELNLPFSRRLHGYDIPGPFVIAKYDEAGNMVSMEPDEAQQVIDYVESQQRGCPDGEVPGEVPSS